MSNTKYEAERAAVELFAAAGGLPGDYSLERGADPPDVLARTPGRLIGIEVRRLFEDEGNRGSAQRRHHGLSREIVDRANAIHSGIETASYFVNVQISPWAKLHKRRVIDIAQTLVHFAREAHLAPGEERTFPTLADYRAGWPQEVDYMCVTLLPIEHGVFWGLSDSAWVGRISPALLQRGLDAKERRLGNYPSEIRERWLLLYCDGSVGSSLLELPEEALTGSLSSSFDRASVLDHTGRRFMDLPLADPGRPA